MIDLFHLVDNNIYNKSIFYYAGGTYQVWVKPRGIIMIRIVCIGAGGSGGGGASGASGTNRGGGGGGASGGISTIEVPAKLLPDVLHIMVGKGGASPAGNIVGNSGGLSYVSMSGSNTATQIVIASSSVTSGGGGNGTTTSGAGGTASPVAGYSNCNFSHLGIFQSLIGIAGASGGSPGLGGTNIILGANGFLSGGAGGGGTDTTNGSTSGGSIQAQNGAVVGKDVSGGINGGDGNSAPTIFKPLYLFPGSGGGGNNTTGGKGGNASFGCGGGGGGSGVTGGAGGEGGNGLIIITCM
jgi:hypothetical protein